MRKGDFLILLAGIIALIVWIFPSGEGDEVKISVDGSEVFSASLNTDDEIVIETEFGKNTIVIENSKVYVKDADCSNKLCEKGHISKGGQSIVCLPNKLVVAIEKAKKDETDVLV